MDQERGFLEAIAEHPDDDLHRLAWADWLDDSGQADRAAFVRAQLRMAALPEDDLARDQAEDEADDLLLVHEPTWIGRVQEFALSWQWRRGCCERVTVRAETLLTQGEELFAQAPIRELRLIAKPEELQRLAECPFLQRVEAIDLSLGPRDESGALENCHRDASLSALMRSPHLKRLTSLELRNQQVEWPFIKTLIDTGLLARLGRLDLRGCSGVGDRAINGVCEAGARQLEMLDLMGTNVQFAGLRTLMQSEKLPCLRDVDFAMPASRVEELRGLPGLSRLTTLTLTGHIPEGVGWEGLLRLLPSGQLQRLSIPGCPLEPERVEVLAGCANLMGLRVLQLPRAQLRDRAATILAGSTYLTQLRWLNLGGNMIGSPGLRAVIDSPNLPGLRELEMWGNFVGTAGAEALAASERPRQLTMLALQGANLDAHSARSLAGSLALSRLRILRLDNNRLGDEGVQILANSPHLRRVRELGLASNGIADCVEALLASRTLGWRVRLWLHGASLSQREREMLRQRFGPETDFATSSASTGR